MRKFFTVLVSIVILVLPVAIVVAVGETVGVGPTGVGVATSEQAVYDTISTAVNYLFAFLLVGAVLVVILAAYTFLTAAGDPDKTTKARNYIMYALLAIVVGFLAKGIVVTVGNMLGVGTSFF